MSDQVQIQAKDVMERNVVVLPPDATLFDAWTVFSERRISGAPVVCKRDGLIGVISQTDLLREVFSPELGTFGNESYYIGGPFWESTGVAGIPQRLTQVFVREAMSPYVISVSPSDEISHLASIMRSRRIHRLIVTEESGVVGIVTSLDLLGVLDRH